MQQPLKAYYLQQMGIETWVRRHLSAPVALLNVIAPTQHETKVMIVLEGGELDDERQWLAGKVGQLLRKMLESIGLSSDKTAILCGAQCSGEIDYAHRDALLQTQILRLQPRVILVLGEFTTQCLPLSDTNFPVILSDHPQALLIHPLKKKQVFSDLMLVRRVLDAGSVHESGE